MLALPPGRRVRTIGWGLALCLGGAVPIWAGETDAALVQRLQRMAQAMRGLDYDATLVYLHDNRLEAMRVIHLVGEGGEREQLISLNGSERGVHRDPQQVVCTLAERGAIGVNKPGVANELQFARNLNPELLGRNYQLRPLGVARVAGRPAEVIGVQPRDGFRYGYRFAIDQETGLLLQSDLLGDAPHPIEQLMLTSLDLRPKGLIEQAASPEPRASAQGPKPAAAAAPPAEASSWSLEGLPAGFELRMRDQWQDGSGKPVTHLLLTDGLAAASVYIESDGQEGLVGGARMGAINAWGGTVSGHQVTVVGEVPAATAQRVFGALRYGGARR